MFVLTLWLPEVINVKLLPFIFMHYPANSKENTQTYELIVILILDQILIATVVYKEMCSNRGEN